MQTPINIEGNKIEYVSKYLYLVNVLTKTETRIK